LLLLGFRLHDIVIEALRQSETTICEIIVTTLRASETRRIPCRPDAVGSVVRIRQNATNAEILTICEVEVYGTLGT